MNLDLPRFSQRFPWWGGNLQTIANIFHGESKDLAPHSSERVAFALRDGSGDRMLGMLDRPAKPRAGQPLVVLIHGMPGSEDSNYMVRMSRCLLDRGHLVLRLNLRGAGPSRAVCGGQYSAGASDDLRLVFDVMPREWLDCGAVAVGYSVGGAILLKYLGEVGEEGVGKPLLAACSVSAPIDLLGTCRDLMGNPFYHAWIFGRMKREALGEGARLTPLERGNIEAAQTIWQFDDVFTASRNSCSGADDYYARCSAGKFLSQIRVPTMVLAALDDPWVPGSAYRGNYWGGNRHLTLVLSEHGGHVGFYAAHMKQTWCDVAVTKFIADRFDQPANRVR